MAEFSSPGKTYCIEESRDAVAQREATFLRQSDAWYVVSLPNGDFEIRYGVPGDTAEPRPR